MTHTLPFLNKLGKSDLARFRGGSRTTATSKMEQFGIIVNGFQLLTIITKSSILDVAEVLDPPLRLVIAHQNKFDTVLNNTNSELLDLKNKFAKLESDLEISRNVNNKLVDQVTRLERKCWENEKFSRRECIEISGIPQGIGQIVLEKKILNVFEKIDVPVDLWNIEACHKLKSDDNMKVIVKFSKRKDMVRVMNKKKSLKTTNLDGTGLSPPSTSLLINPSLCIYYKCLWSKCKTLMSSNLTSSFWVSNGSLQIKLVDDTVKSVTRKDHLKVLFSGNPILIDRE